MRIMLDTNVLISGFAFGSRKIKEMTRWICENHQLVLSSYVVDELREVITRKAPALQQAVDDFLIRLPFELCYSPKLPKPLPFAMRDPDDEAVLYSAIVSEADVLITGDKDFEDIPINKPEILSPAAFMEKYMVE